MQKTISRRRKEGTVEKKACAACPLSGLNLGTLPRARRGSPTACQRGCLDKQAFPWPIARVGRLHNTHVLCVLEIVLVRF